MRKFKHFITASLCAAFVGLSATSCDTSSSFDKTLRSVTHYAARLDGQSQWCLIDAMGKQLGNLTFDSAPTAVVGGCFASYSFEGGITLWRADLSTAEATPIADKLRYAGAMVGDRIPICRPDSAIEIINSAGETIFSLADTDGQSFNACSLFFCDGLLPVRQTTTGLWGAVDRDGDIVIEPTFAFLSSFNYGYALALKTDDTLTIVDTKGNQHSTTETFVDFESPMFISRHALVRNAKGERCAINTRGQRVRLASDLSPVSISRSGIVVADGNGRYGMADFDGKLKIDLQPRRILMPLPLSDKLLTNTPDGSVALIDDSGAIVATAPASVTQAEPLFGASAFLLTTTILAPHTLSGANLQPLESPLLSGFEQRLAISDVILSDRDADHSFFNTADPGTAEPEWITDSTVVADCP